MTRYGAHLLAILSAASLVACTDAYEPTPKTIAIADGWIISGTASLSHTLIRNRNAPAVVCAEPPPDAAFDQGSAADLNISLISLGGRGQNDSGGESESAQEVEMAGRTPAVLLSRELFYRACEFSQNYGLDKAEAIKLYNRTLDIVEKNWGVEADKTTVTIGDTITTTQGATVQAKTTQSETSSSAATSSAARTTGASTTGDGASSDTSDLSSDDSSE